ncbi:MAG: 7-carboxy-7-deazaguanine synthase QueE [Candidatus Wallbacteria bacterium]|nr:7-carboxy-7-deazaguanine synthase QueE [Candidatus Wallbacteria bacterium]
MKARLCELFQSIQGEGVFAGEPHFFIRFSGCNLACSYCDTEHRATLQLEPEELLSACPSTGYSTCCLTGGEPLLQAEFIAEFLPLFLKLRKRVLLETNGTLPFDLSGILRYLDIISMDLKPEAGLLEQQIEFAELSSRKRLYFKLVVGCGESGKILHYLENFTDFNRCEFILQPDSNNLQAGFTKCLELMPEILSLFPRVRILPQIHKWLKIR